MVISRAQRLAVARVAVLAVALGSPAARAVPCPTGEAPVCVTNDYIDFLVMTYYISGDFKFKGPPPLRIIDFETPPEGTPPPNGQITPEYNYTAQGVTFSQGFLTPPQPWEQLYVRFQIAGQPGNRGLQASWDFRRTWIIADLVVPSPAVAIDFPGSTRLSAFDSAGNLLARSDYWGGPGGGWFLGIVSDVPIARITADDGDDANRIDTFFFNPTPEPASAMLILAAAPLLRRFRSPLRRATRRGSKAGVNPTIVHAPRLVRAGPLAPGVTS